MEKVPHFRFIYPQRKREREEERKRETEKERNREREKKNNREREKERNNYLKCICYRTAKRIKSCLK